ncbi:MAG: hypothetical protein RI894_2196, partial [Bacteroidota bacterium]
QYLLLTDSDRDDESIKKNLSISTIKQTLNPNGLNKTLLVIDACRSDDIDAKPDTIATRDKAPRKKGGGKGGDVPDKADGYLNTKTFFASSARHTSHDGNLYSYYTEILIKHLNTVADKKTVSPFFAGVKAEVVYKYKKQSDAVQFPNTEGDFSEEFYLKDAKCKKMVDCGLCKGTGMQETFEICRTCNGKGTTTCVGCEGKALTDKNYICLNCYHKPVICVHCQGNKRLSSFHECSNCHGQGQIEQEIDCK